MSKPTKIVSLMTHEQAMASIERGILLDALNANRWNRSATARELGITFRALRYRIEKLGIEENGSKRKLPEGFGRLWPALRKTAFEVLGRTCAQCGAKESQGAKLHVDHIRPIKTHPELALDFSNLQVLCASCNMSKGATTLPHPP